MKKNEQFCSQLDMKIWSFCISQQSTINFNAFSQAADPLRITQLGCLNPGQNKHLQNTREMEALLHLLCAWEFSEGHLAVSAFLMKSLFPRHQLYLFSIPLLVST